MKDTILVIEDNQEVRENIAEILELANYEVMTAENGKVGLEVIREHLPDLILCDIMMPVLDGYGVLKAIENIPEMIGRPFIFLTAKAGNEDFRIGMDLGADDYLSKPFCGNDLLKIVSTRLRKNKLVKDSLGSSLEKFNNFIDTTRDYHGIEVLTENKNVKKFRKKDLIYAEGEYPNFLYLIVCGKVKIYKSNSGGKEYIIDILKEGDFIGYVALLEESIYKESAMAIENAEIALIPKNDFFKLLYSHNEVAIQFVKMMSRNFADAEEKLLKLAYDSVRKRVAEAIIFVARKYHIKGSNEDLQFTLNRADISALSGISPETVSRNLTDFKEEGLIESSNGSIKIINLLKLEALKN